MLRAAIPPETAAMPTDTRCNEAAALLMALFREGRQIGHLPDALRPANPAEGHAIQAAYATLSDAPPQGWKIAATSAAGQAHINVSGPLPGRILADRLLEPGAPVPLSGNNMRVAELEFAFRLGRDLPARGGPYSEAAIRAAVDALHPAIEMPASRFSDFCAVGEPALIADNACAGLFVIGPAFAPSAWRGRDLAAHRVVATLEGKGRFPGIGGNVLGDPWIALRWLVGECGRLGVDLAAGQIVSTGTCLTPIPVGEGDRLTADFGLGPPLELRFA
jgi:2-keto-4-pentenoate hydratase